MSLCRWSHSPFYIFEECGSDENEIKVQFVGYFKSKEILNNPLDIFRTGYEEGGVLCGLELLIWLYPWAMCQEGNLSSRNYGKILKFTRFLSYVREYVAVKRFDTEYDHNPNMFNYSVEYVDDIIWEIEKFIDNNPIHKLSWEEKRKIFEEEGYW